MSSYRSLLTLDDYAPLVTASALTVAASVLGGLALATSVFARTGSPLLSAVALFGPSFGHLLGASLLLARADVLPPRRALVVLTLLGGLVLLVLARADLPVAAVMAVIIASGVLASLSVAVRLGLLSEILPPDAYVLGRSVLQMTTGAVQVGGSAVAALLLHLMSPAQLLVLAAALNVVAAVVVRYGLARRAPRRVGGAGWRDTWRVNRRLWRLPGVPAVYLALWVPNGLVVGAEALFVPYAGADAGLLFAAGAAGMLVGDAVTGRLIPAHWRARLVTPLRIVLAAPFLLFAVDPQVPLAAVAVAIASAGFSAGLLLQERLLALTPADTRGQALGLHTSGMLAMQGLAALLAGAVAEHLAVGDAMTTMAALSLAATLVLIPKLRQHTDPPPSSSAPELDISAQDVPPSANTATAAGGGVEPRDMQPRDMQPRDTGP